MGRLVPLVWVLRKIFITMQDEIGRWGITTEKQLVSGRFQRAGVFKDVYDHLKRCHGCQLVEPVSWYRSILRMTLAGMFNTVQKIPLGSFAGVKF